MQKKNHCAARWYLGFFLMKYLIRFHDWKTRFTMIDSITIWNNKMATSLILTREIHCWAK